jgi:hypothetical protein
MSFCSSRLRELLSDEGRRSIADDKPPYEVVVFRYVEAGLKWAM